MTPIDLIEKAERALAGARVLLDAEDSEGACSRSYYAMFDAARAALSFVGAENLQASSKTHRGLIAAFGKQVVSEGHVAAELGRSFNRVQNLRMSADYTGEMLSLDDARWAIREATDFVATLRALVTDESPGRQGGAPPVT